jgi:hypothetical protein
MRRPLAILLALLAGTEPSVLWAQHGQSTGQQVPAAAPASPPAPSFDDLGLSFDRIKRELRILPPSTAKTPLKIEYYVEVTGQAPAFQLFKPGELETGPTPWGAPTHGDILDLLTPKVFRSPAIPVSTIAIMGIQKLVEWEMRKAKQHRQEEERQRQIDAERERQERIRNSIVVQPPK